MSPRKMYRVLYSFDAQGSEELSVKENDEVVEVGEPQDGWILVSNVNDPSRKGFIPLGYTEPIVVDHSFAVAFDPVFPTSTQKLSTASVPPLQAPFTFESSLVPNSPPQAVPSAFFGNFAFPSGFTAVPNGPVPFPVYPDLTPVTPDPAFSKTEKYYQEAMQPFGALKDAEGVLTSLASGVTDCKFSNLMFSAKLKRIVEQVEQERILWQVKWTSQRQALLVYSPTPAPPGWVPTLTKGAPKACPVAGTPPVMSIPHMLPSQRLSLSTLESVQGSAPAMEAHDMQAAGPHFVRRCCELAMPVEVPQSPDDPGLNSEDVTDALSKLDVISKDIFCIRDKYEALAFYPIDGFNMDRKEIENARKLYDELLLQQMMRVDGVDSCGSNAVRRKRKAMLSDVERLHSLLDDLHQEEQGQHRLKELAASN